MSELTPRALTDSTLDLPVGSAPGHVDTAVDRAADPTEELRASWQKGQRTPAEVFIRRVGQATPDEETILDLIYAEFVVREEMGERPTPEEYLRRFPQYRQRLERLFTVDRALIKSSHNRSFTPHGSGSGGGVAVTELPRQTIGRYLVLQTLDGGGQGQVYRGLHPTLAREVVIKIARSTFNGTIQDRERLVAEGRLLAELEHPGIARVFDLDFHDNRPFLVLEYIAGRHLEHYAEQEKPKPHRSAWLLAQVAQALAQAHAKGVLHRDIKPRNILIDPLGAPKLIDFGLARLQSAWSDQAEPEGAVMGSVQYMAPEQARGQNDKVGPHSDLFALGGILYYLLTGRAPYKGKNFTETLEQARQGQIDLTRLDRASAPWALKQLCRRLLQADPARRPASAAEVARELNAIATGGNNLRWTVGLAAASVLLAVLGLSWLMASPTSTPSAPPVERRDDGRTRLWVEVFGGERYRDLITQVPLRSGREVRLRSRVPPEMHGVLVSFDTHGHLTILGQTEPRSTEQDLAFPADVHQSATLDGPPGTEVVLLLARRKGPISLEQIEKMWGPRGAWTQIPRGMVLRLRLDDTLFEKGIEARDRSFNIGQQRSNPEGEVRQRLEELRLRLREHFDYFEGLAFAHVE